jgi:hypothetical protein
MKNKHNFTFVKSFEQNDQAPYSVQIYVSDAKSNLNFWGTVKSHDQYICSDCGTHKLKFFIIIDNKKKYVGCRYLLPDYNKSAYYLYNVATLVNPPNCSNVIIKDILE